MQETEDIRKTISELNDCATAHERTAGGCRAEARRLRTAADALDRQLKAQEALMPDAAAPLYGVPAAGAGALNAARLTPARITTDPADPAIAVIEPSGMQAKYLVLSEEERKKGFVRPLRRAYIHIKCGAETKMGLALCETYARQPNFYGGTFCAACSAHFNLIGDDGKRQFHWVEDGAGVGE